MATVGKEITKLSHKLFRALLKKFRRKKKRQLVAKYHEEQQLREQKVVESAPDYLEKEAERERNVQIWEEFQEKERERKHKQWLLREAEAQTAFHRKKQVQEKDRIKREEERKRIVAEIEEKNLLETADLEKKKREQQKKEETLQEALSSLADGSAASWHNPIAPENYSVPSQEAEQCQFYLKTGCCRFGDRCSRGHARPTTSCTLLIKGMYSHFSMGQAGCDDYDTDMALEYEDSETYQDFKNFYSDVLPEFKKFGRVLQFKVCCNHEPHLRGNVYIQYSREVHAVEACRAFNGRYYAGRQLTCEFSNVTNWKSAICGLFFRKRCPKGDNCNFLHVFRNPDNEFWAIDKNNRFGNHGRDRLRPSYSARSHRSNTSNSHHYSYSDRRDRYHSSSSHHSSPWRKGRYRSSESDGSDLEASIHSHKSSHRKSQTSHKRHRSRSQSSSSSSPASEKKSKDDINHKKKKRKSKKKSKKKRNSSDSN